MLLLQHRLLRIDGCYFTQLGKTGHFEANRSSSQRHLSWCRHSCFGSICYLRIPQTSKKSDNLGLWFQVSSSSRINRNFNLGSRKEFMYLASIQRDCLIRPATIGKICEWERKRGDILNVFACAKHPMIKHWHLASV